LSEKQAKHILKVVFDSLKAGGKLIIEENIDPDNFKPAFNEYVSEVNKENLSYKTNFKL